MSPLSVLFLSIIRAYQWLLSPLLGPRCRHLPTCSSYAVEAIQRHGAIKGGWLAFTRIARCHPLGSSGLDPVPKTLTGKWWLGRPNRVDAEAADDNTDG